MLATVVIPCRNRARLLGRCLEALNRQTIRSSVRVVVVDNDSDDDSADVASRFADEVVHASGSHGPGPVRNRGLDEVATELMLTTDADCEPAHDWAERHLAFMRTAPAEVAGTAGRLLPLASDSWWGARDDVTPAPAFGPDGLPLYAVGGNSCLRADVVRRLGGFPSTGADDAALGIAARRAGFRFAYLPGAIVSHANPLTFRGYARQMRKIGAYAAELAPQRTVGAMVVGHLRHSASGLHTYREGPRATVAEVVKPLMYLAGELDVARRR